MVLWKNWWTASSKMLINTLFYIAAFHFSPTNTALTLSVAPLSTTEVIWLYWHLQFNSHPPQHTPYCKKKKRERDICENDLKWDSNAASSCPCHFWSHRYRQAMKANKRTVNDFQCCAWPSDYTSACPRGNTPALPEAKSTRRNTYRMPDKCAHEELVFSITQCTLTNIIVYMFSCAQKGERERGMLEKVHWLVSFASIPDNDLPAGMQNCTIELLWTPYYPKWWYYTKFCTTACSDQWLICSRSFNILSCSTSNDKFALNIVMGLFFFFLYCIDL